MLKIFISSTNIDLSDYRKAAIDVCNELGALPIAMEYFSAMDANAVDVCLSKVREADLYVGIFAHRYGFIPLNETRSITEMEFDEASTHKISRLCFLAKPDYEWPPNAIDYKNYEKLQLFKNRIDSTLTRAEFTTVDNFKKQLFSSIYTYLKEQGLHATNTMHTKPPLTVDAPPQPQLLVGRERDISNLKARFGIGGVAKPLTIIRGWPGIGKTTIVNSLVYDASILRAFPDGIMWASLGDNANVDVQLKAWAQKLGIVKVGATLESLITDIRDELANKRMLLVIDDVWHAGDGIPFKQIAGTSTILMTTRFPGVAEQLTDSKNIYVLGQLSDNDAYNLLAQLAPLTVERYSIQSRQLISDLEGLPLALRVAGRLLESESKLSFDVTPLFNELRHSSALISHIAPDDRFDPHTGTTPTIGLLLKRSTDLLNENSRYYFTLLGAFAPKPATFELGAMKALWEVDDTKSIVRILVDRGLLEPIPQNGRFQMHAVLVMHAKTLFNQTEVLGSTTPNIHISNSNQPTNQNLSQPGTHVLPNDEIKYLKKRLQILQTQANSGRNVRAEMNNVLQLLKRLEENN